LQAWKYLLFKFKYLGCFRWRSFWLQCSMGKSI